MSSSSIAVAASHQIDDALYNRQLYVYGHEAQHRMSSASILILGMNGLGAETAKNIILAGVKSVTVADNTPTTFLDLASQFYLNESHIGQPRAEACVSSLQSLNPYVQVILYEGDITNELLSQFTVVVLIDQPYALQLRISEFCHERSIAFIVGDVKGLCGMTFCDFGPNFTVVDNNGEAAASSMIASIITKDTNTKALVTVLEETPHKLETGDVVSISDVVGMEFINGQEFRVTVKDLFSFEIDLNTSGTDFATYQTGGYINQIKQPTTVCFQSLKESIENPAFCCDWTKLEKAPLLHAAFRYPHCHCF